MTAPTLLQGDCFEVLQTLEAESVDSCVTDPPYGLSFMGKHWDKGVPDADMWRQVYRVLKPGAHLLSFFGTRTYHRGVVAIEDAGFEIRDQIGWLYGSGFPKSLDVSKAIDKAAGADREVVGKKQTPWKVVNEGAATFAIGEHGEYRSFDITAPATEAAKQWDGWGTALKPAWEPIVLARKPLIGTVASNVLEHGVGGLNIDGCRVPHGDDPTVDLEAKQRQTTKPSIDFGGSGLIGKEIDLFKPGGRWPANVIHDGSDEVLAEFAKYGESKSSGGGGKKAGISTDGNPIYGNYGDRDLPPNVGKGDTGTAARFFYTAKASKDDRNDGLHDFPSTLPTEVTGRWPANIIHDGSDEVLAEFAKYGERNSTRAKGNENEPKSGSGIFLQTPGVPGHDFRDTGTAARFFYTSKASKDDRNDGLWDWEHEDAPASHPTVKPTSLMRYLVRLVTPKGGLVLDPFAGSGTTLIAAYREDCRSIGIELDPEYFKMANHRIDKATAQLRLDL